MNLIKDNWNKNDINDFNKEEVFKEDVQQDNIVYITEENYNTAVIIDNNEDCIDAQNSHDNELETFNENLNHVKSSGIKENLNENIEQKNDEKEKFESEQKSLKD